MCVYVCILLEVSIFDQHYLLVDITITSLRQKTSVANTISFAEKSTRSNTILNERRIIVVKTSL